MGKRRAKGDGAVYQRHDAASCPPVDAAGDRPEHRRQGRWVGVVDLGWSGGRRHRRTYYGRTQREARMKVAAGMQQLAGAP